MVRELLCQEVPFFKLRYVIVMLDDVFLFFAEKGAPPEFVIVIKTKKVSPPVLD